MILSEIPSYIAQGLSQATIEEQAPDIPLQQIKNSINHLLGKHRLQIFTDGAGDIVYKEVLQEDAIKCGGLQCYLAHTCNVHAAACIHMPFCISAPCLF